MIAPPKLEECCCSPLATEKHSKRAFNFLDDMFLFFNFFSFLRLCLLYCVNFVVMS